MTCRRQVKNEVAPVEEFAASRVAKNKRHLASTLMKGDD
jgi:hypothetical protein